MNWDDLRFVHEVARLGSLAKAAQRLGVDHTTVGRRVEAAERTLKLKLFTRSASGYELTADGRRLVEPLRTVEEAVLSLARGASAAPISGSIRVTAPESLGVSYLAPRLAQFGLHHPGVTVDLMPGAAVLDLARDAEIAVRLFRSKGEKMVSRRVAEIGFGLYASNDYLRQRPLRRPGELSSHALLLPATGVDLAWVRSMAPAVQPSFVCDVSLGLAQAALARGGVTVLPRYLGDVVEGLTHVPMPGAPSEPVWVTVHADMRQTPRVRAALDWLVTQFRADAGLLWGVK